MPTSHAITPATCGCAARGSRTRRLRRDGHHRHHRGARRARLGERPAGGCTWASCSPTTARPPRPEAIRRIAESAELLGFDSVWATEHVLVGPAGAAAYGRVYSPFATLGWIAGFTQRVELGTSIVIAPLHSPMRVAKEIVTLSELGGRRVRLGVGAGWHEDEFRFMGVDFDSRGRRTDEAIRVIRALWSGADTFDGEFWQFADATFAPLPVARCPRSGSAASSAPPSAGRSSSVTCGIRARTSTWGSSPR